MLNQWNKNQCLLYPLPPESNISFYFRHSTLCAIPNMFINKDSLWIFLHVIQTQLCKILNLTCEFSCITGAGGGGAARGNLFGEAAGALFGGGGGERETMCELCGGKALSYLAQLWVCKMFSHK